MKRREPTMKNPKAAQMLKILAKMESSYELRAAEFEDAVEFSGFLPPDYPAEVLDALCTVPEVSEQVERIRPNLPESYSPVDWLPLVTAVLVLLGAYGGVEYKNGKWSFRAGYKPLNAKALKPLLTVLAAAVGKVGKGLVELSETLDGKDRQTSTNAE